MKQYSRCIDQMNRVKESSARLNSELFAPKNMSPQGGILEDTNTIQLGSKPDEEMVKKLIIQGARERTLAIRYNIASILIAYLIINALIFLDIRESNVLVLAIAAILGLAVILSIGYVREIKLHQREARYQFLGLLSSSYPYRREPAFNASSSHQLKMTEREIEVLFYVAKGETDKRIANRMNLSPHTIKNHLRNIYNKLGVNDRTSASLMAIRYGLLELGAGQIAASDNFGSESKP